MRRELSSARKQFRVRGLKVAREPHRYSGRTAMRAKLSVHEPRQPQDADSALAVSMEGHNGTQAGARPTFYLASRASLPAD